MMRLALKIKAIIPMGQVNNCSICSAGIKVKKIATVKALGHWCNPAWLVINRAEKRSKNPARMMKIFCGGINRITMLNPNQRSRLRIG